MTKYVLYRNRREALGWTIQELSEKSNVHILEVMWFEEGKKIGYDKEQKIKEALYHGFYDLPSKDHYKARILELALQINSGDLDQTELLNAISHISIEIGKLQGETLGFSRQYRD